MKTYPMCKMIKFTILFRQISCPKIVLQTEQKALNQNIRMESNKNKRIYVNSKIAMYEIKSIKILENNKEIEKERYKRERERETERR